MISLLGVEFTEISQEQALERLLSRPESKRFAYVVTANADHFERLLRIPRLHGVYRRAMLCLMDSRLIYLCARALGLACPPTITGADLTAALLPRLGGRRVAVVGMRAEDFATLAARYPEICFIHHNPPMGLLHDPAGFAAAVEFVHEAQAPFTFFAVGSPVQELLAYAVAMREGAVGVGLCIGVALEFAAGTARRAPLWMRRCGLEWLHRLAHNPWRLAGRYLIADPRVFIALVEAALRQKMH